jgi:6-phosphogluconolactonase (cycloisomerase 2 family)
MLKALPNRHGHLSLVKLLVVVLVLFHLTASGFAQQNLLYINTNVGLCPTCGANKNQILIYSIASTGALTKLAGQYFTGGTGVYNNPPGNEVEADQQIIVNKAGTLLFAVNGHSNTVAVFTINADGTLTAITGSPFASNGPQPASVGLLEDPKIGNGNSILVVANKDNDPLQPPTAPNWSTFTVASSGTMTLNTGATVALQQGSSPSQALISTKGDLLFGMLFLGDGTQGSLTSYRISKTGTLTPITTVTTPNSGKFFLGEVVHPINTVVYTGLPDQALFGVYTYGQATGKLTFDLTQPSPGLLPCWMAINKEGTRLYIVENGSSTITVYDVTDSLSPTQLQHVTLRTGGSFGATNVVLDPTEKFLFVLTGSSLHELNIASDGSLTETHAPRVLPVPTGTIPTGMVTLQK